MGIGLWPAGRRHVTMGIIIPVVLSLLAMTATVGGFVYWSTSNSDSRALERQTALLDHYMRNDFHLQVEAQEAATITADAVINTRIAFKPDWVDEHLGTAFYETYGYEQTIVLDGENRPIYFMEDGKGTDAAKLGYDLPEIMPLVKRLRADLATGSLRAYLGGARRDVPSAGDYVTVAGTPAMVTVIPIADSAAPQKSGTEYLHVAIDFLDEDYAEYVGDANLAEDVRFERTASRAADVGLLPLINASGRIVAFLEWRQDWPGRRLLIETVPALLAALLCAIVLVAALLRRLWRYAAALEKGRVDAEHQANHDALTGLPNRSFFERRLGELTGQAGRKGYIGLFMLDLDRFKQVNDTFGHPAGDELIRAVGGRLRNAVTRGALIARLGGDEFAIIEPAISGPAEAMAMADRIVELIGRPFDLSGNTASVGVSIGIGLSDDAMLTPPEMVRRADIALYEAKAGGRNRAMIYAPSMDVAVHQRHSIEAELREALGTGGQIEILFEPIIEARSGLVTGAQALPRWLHPLMGEVPAAIFLPVAESSGLIDLLGEQTLRAACRLGAQRPDSCISVQVFLPQIRSPNFFSRVFDILRETGMRPANLELEIAEKVLLEGPGTTGDVIGKLRAAGIGIALADFGAGYSSLTFLKQHEVDHIRIDHTIAQEAGEDRSALAMVEAMVGLAHAMHITVTAKGIDTAPRRSRFAAIGCDRLQGAQISPALPFSEMLQCLASGRPLAMRPDAA